MVTALLALAVALQGGSPELTVTVDHDQVMVGEEIEYTITATNRSSDPLRVRVQSVDGFDIVSRTEETAVSFNPVTRTSRLVLRLRAVKAGTHRLGPVEAVAAGGRADAPGREVEVSESRGAVAAAVNPRVARLLQQTAPPRLAGEVGLTVLLSKDTAVVGEQIDIVTAAWFPRTLRLRLRRPPTLQPPRVNGLWSYPQPSPVGIAASRQVGGAWYDLFVSHEVAFPLTSGDFVLEPATLRYSVPLALQFFSQEERMSLESARPTLTVRPLPAAGQPAGFQGAAGRGLGVVWSATGEGATVGEPTTMAITIRGDGNVALWPEPTVAWPDGTRAYQDHVTETSRSEGGTIGGTKTFSWVVVPAQVGSVAIPAVEYPYYDLDAGTYHTVTLPPRQLLVAPAVTAAASRALPPPLLTEDASGAARWLDRLPLWGWALLFGLPPVVAGARRIPHRKKRPPPAKPVTDLRAAERRFETLLRLYLPPDHSGDDGELVAALEAAGVEEALATSVEEMRRRLRLSRYGPDGNDQDRSLARRLQALCDQLAAGPPAAERQRAFMTLMLLAMAAWVGGAQGPGPIALYDAGALAAASQGFAREARAEPWNPAPRYNHGAAEYRLGHTWEAAAAWHEALRLAPRNATVRRALALVPAPDPVSGRRLYVPPFRASEMWALAAACWLMGWIGLMLARRSRRRWRLVLAMAVVAAGGAGLAGWWETRAVAIIRRDVPLAVSPHGLAPELQQTPAGTAVRLLEERPGWALVETPNDRRGWVPQAALLEVGDYLSGP